MRRNETAPVYCLEVSGKLDDRSGARPEIPQSRFAASAAETIACRHAETVTGVRESTAGLDVLLWGRGGDDMKGSGVPESNGLVLAGLSHHVAAGGMLPADVRHHILRQCRRSHTLPSSNIPQANGVVA